MNTRFFQVSFSGLGHRPLLAALIAYWIAIAAAALTLAFAVREGAASDRGVHLPFLAALAPRDFSATTIGAA